MPDLLVALVRVARCRDFLYEQAMGCLYRSIRNRDRCSMRLEIEAVEKTKHLEPLSRLVPCWEVYDLDRPHEESWMASFKNRDDALAFIRSKLAA